MASDRFIYWREKRPKSAIEIASLITGYMGAAQTDVSHTESNGQHHWIISIPGVGCNPLCSFSGIEDTSQKERWFEVFLTDESLDVLTRMQDPFTNAIAEGFAEMITRWYEAERAPN